MSKESAAIARVLKEQFSFDVLPKGDTSTDTQVRLMGRVPAGSSRDWKVAMAHLLEVAEGNPWNVDISVPYFRQGGRMVWAWRVIFQHPKMSSQLQSVVTALQTSPKARFEVVEQQLPGVAGRRSMMNERGKGAVATGSSSPLILQRAGR